MKIAELTSVRHFDIVEGTSPEPGAGEVQVRVRDVGICGSDMHNFLEGGIGDTPSRYPMVLGHEPAGEVVKTGAGVTGWSAGDRAALEPAVYCYHCEYCRTGRHNVCANIRFLSNPGEPGFFREFVNLPAVNLLPLPSNVGWREATLFEPLAVALHSIRLADVAAGETAAVFGAGPIGLLTIAALKLAGASRIWAVEPVRHRREMALAAGATAANDVGEAVRAILADTAGRGVDAAFDCAAKGDSTNACLRVARNAGRVALTGIPGEIMVPIEFHVMRRKELQLLNVRRSNHQSQAALELLRDHNARFAAIVTHTRPLDRVQAAFQMLEHYDDGVGKLVIEL